MTEAYFWVCLWGYLQKGLMERKSTLSVIGAAPWARHNARKKPVDGTSSSISLCFLIGPSVSKLPFPRLPLLWQTAASQTKIKGKLHCVGHRVTAMRKKSSKTGNKPAGGMKKHHQEQRTWQDNSQGSCHLVLARSFQCVCLIWACEYARMVRTK